MKLFFLIFLCALAALPLQPKSVAAAASAVEWVRVVEDTVCVYANAESSKVLFRAEKSYYLRVLAEEGHLYLVSVMENETNFPTITGYVWKSEVEACEEEPKTPYYPTERVTVDSDSAQLKLTPTPSSETMIVITNSQKMSYYGAVTSYSETWYYVYFCGKFGYVLAENVTAPAIELHPTPLETEVVEEPIVPGASTSVENNDDESGTDDSSQESGNATEIALIVFVALLSLGICLALFLPGNLKKKNDTFEDV